MKEEIEENIKDERKGREERLRRPETQPAYY